MITASLLKLQKQGDVILFDSEGKLLGVTKEFFEDNFKRANPFLSLEKFSSSYVFLFFPQILSLIY